MRTLPAVVCLALLLFVPSRPALSDPLVVMGSPGSFLIFDFEGDFFRFAGNDFAIGVDNGMFFPRLPVQSCSSCRAGEVLNMSFQTPGEVALGPGNATLGAVTYTGVPLRASLNFSVPPIAFPSSGGDVLFPSAPFTFSGLVRGLRDGAELFAVSLIGQGRVSQPFVTGVDGVWTWEEGRRDYRFADSSGAAPVPEPATLLMLCAGVAGAARVRAAGRARSRQADSAMPESVSPRAASAITAAASVWWSTGFAR